MAKKTINDPVFGDLEYNEKGYWIRKISLSMWGVEEEIDLIVKCGTKEDIIDDQRNAYRYYLESLKKIEKSIPDILFSYYNDHYEDIARKRDVEDDEELRKDSVSKLVVLDYSDIKSLFIDRNGNYGWLVNFIWNDYPISVILSDDKIRIYERWGVLVDNYTKVNDEVFGEMVNDRFTWKKLVKKDLFGVKGKWITVAVPSFDDISQEQRTRYLEYKEKEEDFIDKIPNALMTYYLENYKGISSWWNVPPKYNRQNINTDSLMELVTFHRLYFHMDGKRYGWLCGCEWDKIHGLSFYYDGENDEMQVGWQEDLFD